MSDLKDLTVLDAQCVVCSGQLTRITGHEYLGDPMNMILGPGSLNQMSQFSYIYCDNCGLDYYQLPKRRKR